MCNSICTELFEILNLIKGYLLLSHLTAKQACLLINLFHLLMNVPDPELGKTSSKSAISQTVEWNQNSASNYQSFTVRIKSIQNLQEQKVSKIQYV